MRLVVSVQHVEQCVAEGGRRCCERRGERDVRTRFGDGLRGAAQRRRARECAPHGVCLDSRRGGNANETGPPLLLPPSSPLPAPASHGLPVPSPMLRPLPTSSPLPTHLSPTVCLFPPSLPTPSLPEDLLALPSPRPPMVCPLSPRSTFSPIIP